MACRHARLPRRAAAHAAAGIALAVAAPFVPHLWSLATAGAAVALLASAVHGAFRRLRVPARAWRPARRRPGGVRFASTPLRF